MIRFNSPTSNNKKSSLISTFCLPRIHRKVLRTKPRTFEHTKCLNECLKSVKPIKRKEKEEEKTNSSDIHNTFTYICHLLLLFMLSCAVREASLCPNLHHFVIFFVCFFGASFYHIFVLFVHLVPNRCDERVREGIKSDQEPVANCLLYCRIIYATDRANRFLFHFSFAFVCNVHRFIRYENWKRKKNR